ncbi:MAG: Hemolysin-type calcium-binding repeat (2 copies) [Rhodobacteraceae bacterium HLUCCA08]|nr:MAG: Hemolysin-type calcium-binding repeat (2 copies) [Rhodobacteraceae bacterium HLUCCA08]
MALIQGGTGNDSLEGTNGADLIYGYGGNDDLFGSPGGDLMDGGAGDLDTADYSGSLNGVTVNLDTGVGDGGLATGDTLVGIEIVIGSDAGDTLIGDDKDNNLWGRDGDDTLIGGLGDDNLQGEGGFDTVDYSDSDAAVEIFHIDAGGGGPSGGHAEGDFLKGIEKIIGSDFDDTIYAPFSVTWSEAHGGDGNDALHGVTQDVSLYGGSGDDYLRVAFPDDSYVYGGLDRDEVDFDGVFGVTANLGTGMVNGNERLFLIEDATGTGSTDILIGTSLANTLDGSGGDDTLEGMGGADHLIGGAGIDTARYTSSTGGVIVDLETGTGDDFHANGDILEEIENIRGSNHGDTLLGDANDNTFWGQNGDDTFDGRTGDDTYFGGAGNDLVSFASSATGRSASLATDTGGTFDSIESLQGSDRNDTLTGNSMANTITGGLGDDTLAGLQGADRLGGGGGSDTADYRASTASVSIDLVNGTGTGGHAEGDELQRIENVQGSDYFDVLIGDAEVNRLYGNGDNDLLIGGAGADFLYGGDGDDTAIYTESGSGVTVDLQTIGANPYIGAGTGGDAEGDVLDGIENVDGSRHDDVLTGSNADNTLFGDDGDDTFFVTGGQDVLGGGDGEDTVDFQVAPTAVGTTVDLEVGYYTLGAIGPSLVNDIENVVGTDHDDTLLGNAFDNTLEGGAGDDTISGGLGLDVASYAGATGGVSVYLMWTGLDVGGGAGIDTLSGIENLLGSDHDDRLAGDTGDNTLRGRDGDDILNGKGGNDVIRGGGGHDKITAADGNDSLYGGTGDDTIFGLGGDDLIDGGADNDWLYGGRDADLILGGDGDDQIRGNIGHDDLQGGLGDDDLRGGAGDDTLSGGADDDFLVGENGEDTLEGGSGDDVMIGGFDSVTPDGLRDVFVYKMHGGNSGYDRIRGWEDGIDQIDLTDFQFNSFTIDVFNRATDIASGLRIDFGLGNVLLIEDFTKADFDAGDVMI